MDKIKLNKKIVITASYVIAILFAIALTVYPETNSIFIKENDKSLVYKSNLLDKTLGNVDLGIYLNEDSSNIDIARISLNLTRDQRFKNENEYYIVEGFSSLSNNETVVCNVVPKSNTPNLEVIKETIEGKTIYKIGFNKTSSTIPEIGTIDIECDVTKNMAQQEDIDVLVKVYEAIGEESRFLYQSKTLDPKIKYQDYKELYQPADPNKTIYFEDKDGNLLEDEDIYLAFLAIMRDYYVNVNYYATTYDVLLNSFEAYINDYGTIDSSDEGINRDNAKKMLMSDTFAPLLGIQRYPMKDSEGVNLIGYSFEFDENLTSYVKTYLFYKTFGYDINSYLRIYFSPSKDNESKDVRRGLKEILSNFIYPDEEIILTIDDETKYTKADLVFEYINDYIVNEKNGVYSLENLKSMEEIMYTSSEELKSDGESDIYPQYNFIFTILDMAYNHFSGEKGIRVSHYAIPYVINIVFKEAIKIYDTSFQNVLKTTLGNTSSNLYKNLTCTSDCTTYTEKFIDGSYTYTVKIEPNNGYNFITIDKELTPIEGNIKIDFDTASNMIAELKSKLSALESTSKYNDVKTIMENNINDSKSNFYKAITSRTTTSNDTEIYYANGNIYSVTIKHNSTNNEVVVAKENNLKTAISKIYKNTLPVLLQEEINTSTSTLNKNVSCTTNCSSYNDMYFDGTNYSAVKVTNNGTYNKVEVVVNNDFEKMMSGMYNDSLAKSLASSFRRTNAYINSAIKFPQTGLNYLEIHYDSDKKEYVLFKVAHTATSNIISSYVLKSDNSSKNTEIAKAIAILKEEYEDNGLEDIFVHTKNEVLASELENYLQQFLDGEYVLTNTSDPDYIINDFLIEGIK